MPWKWTWTPMTESDTNLNVGERADRGIANALASDLGQWELVGTTAGPPPLSRSQIQKLLEAGKITQNKISLTPKSKLKAGLAVVLELPDPRRMELIPEDRPLEILYEDSHIVVINKPQGLTVHPSETQHEGTLVHALLHHIQDLSGIGGVFRPGIVHRIDKNTSGVLVVSKSDAAHLKLSEYFSKHDIQRTYWALVYGTPKIDPKSPERRIESLIGRSLSDRKKMSMKVKRGRKAVSKVRLLETYANVGTSNLSPFAAWVSVDIETGRTHQIRVHLTGIGHSVLGDPTYGTPTSQQPKWKSLPQSIQKLVSPLQGQMLHAHVLGFNHPITGEPLRFEAPPPPDFQNLLHALQAFKVSK